MNKQSVSTSPSGSVLSINEYEISGISEDKKVYLQANVHGAEVQGNAVIFELYNILLQNKEIISGSIVFVPQANPLACNQKTGTWTQGRFNSVTGDNWNRLYLDTFKNYDFSNFISENSPSSNKTIGKFKTLIKDEIKKNLEHLSSYGPNENKLLFLKLQDMASDSDIVLDLHTGPIACDYLYAPEFLKNKCLDLNFPHHLIIPNEFGQAFDEATFMPWVHLKEAYEKAGKDFNIPFESYTLELGSEEIISKDLALKQASNILQFLVNRGVLARNPLGFEKQTQVSCELSDFKTYYAKTGGLYEFLKAPGQRVKKGEKLCRILHFEEQMKEEFLLAKQDCLIINHTTSANIRSGMELYQVMENLIEH